MNAPLLNEYQSRRITTNLQLMHDDLAALSRSEPMTQEGAAFDTVRALIARINAASDELREALHLGSIEAPDFRRRVAAVAEIWAVRMEDLAARRLTGYGDVHPDLAARLDHRIANLSSLLLQLVDAAAHLPPGES